MRVCEMVVREWGVGGETGMPQHSALHTPHAYTNTHAHTHTGGNAAIMATKMTGMDVNLACEVGPKALELLPSTVHVPESGKVANDEVRVCVCVCACVCVFACMLAYLRV